MKKQLKTYCELYWWNMGNKTVSFKGTLKDLLEKQNITYTKRKTEHEGLYNFHFKNNYGISFKARSTIDGFPNDAKKFIQMELVRMGDPSQLYVAGTFRSTVTVNR